MNKKSKGDHHPGRKQRSKKEPKRIFLFSDGTGNAASTLTKTNVWRMYQALEKGGEQKPVQVALYDNGVGTGTFRPLVLIAGVFGFGLKRNVLDLYRFLCLQYEEDAEIYLVGFSRGAFTMRLLAAMVGLNGIIKVRPHEGGISATEIDRAGSIAFQELSNLFPSRNPLVQPFRWLRGIFTKKKFCQKGTHFEDLPRHVSRDIEFIGLFDTVSAYGGPVQEFTDAFSWLFFPTEPADWSVGQHVRKVCHALALDEPRHSFWPKLISEAEDPQWSDPRTIPKLERGERIEQVWFTGAHAHVGGGYANDGLSMVPLNWMLEKLTFNHQIRFNEQALANFREAEDCCAPMLDPRDGTGFIYRYNPRNLSRMTEDPNHHIYTGRPKIHHSVFDRMMHNPDYAPTAINRDYEIVDRWKAKNHHAIYTRKADFHLDEDVWLQENGNNEAGVSDANMMNPLFTGKRFNAHVEAAWDDIWLRRVIFAFQMFLMLVLIASPWLFERVENSKCENLLCFLREPIKTLATLLPGPTQPWVDVFSTYPAQITALLGLFAFTIIYGRSVRSGINATLIDYWHYLVGRTEFAPPTPKKSPVYSLRTNAAYRFVFHRVKKWLMTVVFGLLIAFAGIMAVNQTLLYVRDRSAPAFALCNSPESQLKKSARFQTKDLCVDTGVNVVKGVRYAVTITPNQMAGPPTKFPWRDKGIPAAPYGLKPDSRSRFFDILSVSAKRHPFHSLFAPMVVINQRFPKTQTLMENKPWPTQMSGQPAFWEATFTATESGRAYFYVNDIALGFASRPAQVFYNNNKGGGSITIAERYGPLL